MIMMIACWYCWWIFPYKVGYEVIKNKPRIIKTYQQVYFIFLSVNVIITNVIINCSQITKLIIYFFFVIFSLLKSSWNLPDKKNIFFRNCQNYFKGIHFSTFANYFIKIYLHLFYKLSTLNLLWKLLKLF